MSEMADGMFEFWTSVIAVLATLFVALNVWLLVSHYESFILMWEAFGIVGVIIGIPVGLFIFWNRILFTVGPRFKKRYLEWRGSDG